MAQAFFFDSRPWVNPLPQPRLEKLAFYLGTSVPLKPGATMNKGPYFLLGR